MDEQEFIKELEKKHIILTQKQIDQFSRYYEILVAWNQKMNLTAITEKQAVYSKHFYDSISIAFSFPFTNQNMVDVGAGAGFPSIPLKIIYPHLHITIVDSLGKRITFLQALFSMLELENCQAVHARAEEYVKEHREKYDVAMARAVAKLAMLDELCLPFVKVNGYFLALKGKKAKEEIQEAKQGIQKLGGKIEKEISFLLYQEEHRTNIIIKKEKETPKKYPRSYAQIKKDSL